MTSPVQRTIRELKNRGRVCAIVERWNAHARIRQDLWGILDVLALDPERGVMGIQVCKADFASHHRKFTEEKVQECVDWLQTPGTTLYIWSWRKVKVKRGGKAMIWQPRIREYTLADFTDEDPLKQF